LELQRRLDLFFEWCTVNDMILNVNKCYQISFSRSNSPLRSQYFIGGFPIASVSEIRDLGVVFDPKLTFYSHIDQVVSRGFRMLGFVMRAASDLSVEATKILYCALVRSILEFASTVWSPHYSYQIDNLEKVQRKFLRMAAFKLGWSLGEYDYDRVLQHLNLHSLECRRVALDMCFLHKLLSGSINCHDLLSSLPFNVPARLTRHPQLFYGSFHGTNYGQHAPLNRLIDYGNRYSPLVNFFGSSVMSFKKQMLQVQNFKNF
jgi:hypothetical protein